MKMIKASTIVAYIVMIVTNSLAILLPIGGRSTGQVSENYSNLFAPAGYAFSIWGLIYALLGIYVIYQFQKKKNNLTEKINKIFIVNALLNASWIFAWHYDVIWLSVIIMLGLLLTLIKIADILKSNSLTSEEKWFIKLPFSVYFGWITVATIANITVFLVYLKWNGFGIPESYWTVIVLLVGMLIGSWRTLKDRAIPYMLVFIWAYGAILFKHLSVSGFNGQYPVITSTVSFCLLVFLGIIIFMQMRKRV